MATEDKDKSVDTILKERGEVYGDFKGNLQLRVDMMYLIDKRYMDVNGISMDKEQTHMFQDVIAKLARLSATPNHIDSWKDLAGYATLVEGVINEK